MRGLSRHFPKKGSAQHVTIPSQEKQGREKTNLSLCPVAGKISVRAGDILEIRVPAGSNRWRSRLGDYPERQVHEDRAYHF